MENNAQLGCEPEEKTFSSMPADEQQLEHVENTLPEDEEILPDDDYVEEGSLEDDGLQDENVEDDKMEETGEDADDDEKNIEEETGTPYKNIQQAIL